MNRYVTAASHGTMYQFALVSRRRAHIGSIVHIFGVSSVTLLTCMCNTCDMSSVHFHTQAANVANGNE